MDVGRRCGGEGEAEQAFAARFQQGVQPVQELGRIDDAEEFDIVIPEHDAVVAGAPADMTATRGHGEAQMPPRGTGGFKVADADQGVIDPAQRIGGDGGHQYDDPGCFRNSISSSVEGRPRMRLRWGKRPNRSMMRRCPSA